MDPSPASRLVLAACSALVIGLVLSALVGDGGVARHGPLRRELGTLEREVRALEAENRALSREVEALRTDSEYMESVARDELGWVRPGERVVVFRD
jgi:cell division protein FtsB